MKKLLHAEAGEEKNNKILSKLKNLGVKSFEGITISTTEA
jgi:hypothetical protein